MTDGIKRYWAEYNCAGGTTIERYSVGKSLRGFFSAAMIGLNMSSDDEPVPLEACTPPGTINVTDRALQRAVQFQAAVPTGWIVAFSWYEGSRIRASKDAPWVDQGPGLELGAYRIGQIPEEAIWNAGSLRYAVLIWKNIIDSHPKKTIDLDERGNPVLT